jgi:hypothetical protein
MGIILLYSFTKLFPELGKETARSFQEKHTVKYSKNLIPYDKMMEWYRKKSELFIYHPADSANFWKELR